MLADEVGFEPTDPYGSPVFKTGALDHSATHPRVAGHVTTNGNAVQTVSGRLADSRSIRKYSAASTNAASVIKMEWCLM